ncbi:hypothetical protein [Enterovibrio paralichthyis]|uniref:hypothetical protein n=1 Tax=Enterovibrio paralichthyis TaxID=2853805 RepID=UPI001C45B397|nr:hypothetical protein [Enterovibrio paralichthyis]
MNHIEKWLQDIQQWYENPQHRDIGQLSAVIEQAPASLFEPPIDHTSSDAIAYFVDGCIRLQRHYEFEGKSTDAYSYLQFCYAKLQALASRTDIETEVRRWSLKKLDQLIVSMMEFCQHQNDAGWLSESKQLIELHVAFMVGQNNLNLYQPQRPL